MEFGFLSVQEFLNLILPLLAVGCVLAGVVFLVGIKMKFVNLKNLLQVTKVAIILGLCAGALFFVVPLWFTKVPLSAKIATTVVGLLAGAAAPWVIHILTVTSWDLFNGLRRTDEKEKRDKDAGGHS